MIRLPHGLFNGLAFRDSELVNVFLFVFFFLLYNLFFVAHAAVDDVVESEYFEDQGAHVDPEDNDDVDTQIVHLLEQHGEHFGGDFVGALLGNNSLKGVVLLGGEEIEEDNEDGQGAEAQEPEAKDASSEEDELIGCIDALVAASDDLKISQAGVTMKMWIMLIKMPIPKKYTADMIASI